MNHSADDCRTAELHLIDKIQSHGVLLAVEQSTGRVSACSENAKMFLRLEAQNIIGRHWSDFFQANDISFETFTDSPGIYFPGITESVLNGIPAIISSHPRGQSIIVEIERRSDDLLFERRDRLSFLQQLASTETPEHAARLLMKHIARITGFDRVMLYKFMADWHGQVIDEQIKPGVQGFLGLHFPAGDIPENARRLYVINTQRIIVDVESSDVNIIAIDENSKLDLTYALLRAVHPVHIQYLKNIGARTSYSVSIIVSGKLWGMIACHNLHADPIGVMHRLLCEELARTVSLHMSGLNALEAERRRSGFFAVISAFQMTLKTDVIPADSFYRYAAQFLQLFSAEGIWLKVDDTNFRFGTVRKISELTELMNWLTQLDNEQVFHTNTIATQLKSCPSLIKHASGILFIPLGDRGFIMFCRNEQIENVQWAGRQGTSDDPDVQANENNPRNSFETWSEQVLGQGIAWDDIELEAAIRLRNTMIDYLEKTELEQMALQDGLTGLANRALFENELETAIGVSKSTGTIVAVFMLDLDKFKPVNDTWGHGAGDELLIQVGKRLKKIVRGRDTAARFGGDEFAVILYHFIQISEVENVASRIIEEMHTPFRLKEAEVKIGASLGIALYPEHAEDPQELIEKADIALYKVKRSGRNAWCFYDHSMQK